MSQKVKAGETRETGWLYFVKGKSLEVWKARMARGGRKKKKTAKKSTTKRTTKRKRR